jgi:hypothetical protein
VLARAERLLGTPVPDDLDRRLGLSRGFGRLVHAVDSAWPVPALRKETSWPRLVARAARPSALGTAARALQSAAAEALDRARSDGPSAEPAAPATRADVEAWVSAVERVAGVPTVTR